MSSAYGWTPEQLGNMTIAQLYHWGADTPDVDGVKQFSIHEQLTFSVQMEAAKAKWISRMKQAAGV